MSNTTDEAIVNGGVADANSSESSPGAFAAFTSVVCNEGTGEPADYVSYAVWPCECFGCSDPRVFDGLDGGVSYCRTYGTVNSTEDYVAMVYTLACPVVIKSAEGDESAIEVSYSDCNESDVTEYTTI